LLRLIRRLHAKTLVSSASSLNISDRASVFDDPKMTTVSLVAAPPNAMSSKPATIASDPTHQQPKVKPKVENLQPAIKLNPEPT
jgi:hypothetical protein